MAETKTEIKRGDIPALTGLRFLAAATVMIGHCANVAYQGAGPITSAEASASAYFGMSLFFCLSGFVIYYNYRDIFTGNVPVNIWNFFVARVARLYPLYLAIMLYLATPTSFISGEHLTHHILLIQSWFNSWRTPVSPTWSVSTEMFFYFAFAVFGVFLVRLKRPLLGIAAVFAAAALWWTSLFFNSAAIANWFGQVLLGGQYDDPPLVIDWLNYASPFTRIFEFSAGALAAKIAVDDRINVSVRNVRLLTYGGLLGMIAAIVFAVIFAVHFPGGVIQKLSVNFLYAPFICVIMLGIARGKTLVSRLFASRPFVISGELSYSLYFTQFLAFGFIESNAGWVKMQSWSLFWAFVAMAYFLSYASYNLIEVPGRKLIRRALTIRSTASRAPQNAPAE